MPTAVNDGAIGYANVVRDETGIVEGAFYEVEEPCVGRLDDSERYPHHYDRVQVMVEVEGLHHECWAYVAQPEKVSSGLAPTREYLDHILGCRDIVTPAYLRTLELTPTYVSQCGVCTNVAEGWFTRSGSQPSVLCHSCYQLASD